MNKIFLDIGNTNFKILIDNKFILKNNYEIDNFLSNFNKNSLYFISCNNNKIINKIINLSKKNNNIILVSKEYFLDKLNIDNSINKNEIGLDLLIISYWFIFVLNKKNGVIIISGTFLVCIVIKDKIIISINIYTNLEHNIKCLEEVIQQKIKLEKYSLLGTNNFSSVYSSYLIQLFGLIEHNTKLINNNEEIIISGNQINNQILLDIKNKFDNIKYKPNIILECLKHIFN